MSTDPDISTLIRRAMDRFKHVRAFLARAEAEEARPAPSRLMTPEECAEMERQTRELQEELRSLLKDREPRKRR